MPFPSDEELKILKLRNYKNLTVNGSSYHNIDVSSLAIYVHFKVDWIGRGDWPASGAHPPSRPGDGIEGLSPGLLGRDEGGVG